MDTQSRIAIEGVTEEQILPRRLIVPAFDVAEEEVIGQWADGACSAARIASGDATWWAFAVCPVTPGLLRELGRAAGCVVVNEHDDALLHGAGLLVLHTIDGGSRRLRFPSGRVVDHTLRPRSTVVFDAATGAVLLP